MGLLEGRRIVVTGGASGMGAATVRAYAREGARIVSIDVNDEAGTKVAEEAAKLGGEVRFERCDISSREIFPVMEEAIEWLGGLDVLANVAGIERGATPEDVTEDEWDHILDCNVRGTLYTNQIAFRHMKDRGGGRIINYGSGAGIAGMVDAPHYSVSKGAILGWSRAIAGEWGRYGISVVAMTPAIWTSMYEAYREREPQRAALSDRIMEGTDPDRDMGPVMVFFASEGAHAISGQHVGVGKIGSLA